MRRAITAISFTLSGASVLIFISALLIPILRESAPQRENSKTDVYKSSSSFKKTIEKPKTEQTQSLAVTNKTESSIKGVVSLPSPATSNNNEVDNNRKDLSAMQSLQTSPETTISRIREKSPEPVNPMDTEEKRSSQHKPMRLLVLGGGSFSPGQIKPDANAQKAIDGIIPLIKGRSLDKVIVEGHADKSIPDGFSPIQAFKWNKIISMQRAKAIALVLKQKGVASDRIIVKGLGDTVPLASNHTKEGRSKNRRVEIILTPTRQ
jgi:outer membrane protein OmpA-like peptidoglycan-associated protein